MIISRYLIKDVLNALLAVTLVLLLIFLSNLLIRYLGYAAAGKFASNILLQLIGFEIPSLLAILLPLGLYLGIILTYSRLYADSEMRVLHACGFSIKNLLKITSLLALIVMSVSLVLMLWLNPYIEVEKAKMLARSANGDAILDTLIPGRFQVSNDGQRVIYVEKISRNHKEADNLFIAEQGKNLSRDEANSWVVLSAEHGYQTTDAITRNRFVVAANGNRYEGVPGQNDYKIIQFSKYAVSAPVLPMTTHREEQEAISTKTLLQRYWHSPENAAELQWRISIPLAAFLLALLAIPFSQVKPRQGRYAMIFPAILVYVVYMNLLFVARNFVEQKMVPLALGVWWVHGVMLAFIAILLLMQARWRVKNI